LKTFRILTSALGAIAVLAAALIVAGTGIVDYLPQVTLGILIVFFFSAASNTLNDYIDRESDKKNHPERPIPSGKLKPKTALIAALFIFLLALAGSWFINMICFSLVALAFVIELAYEFLFKKFAGIGNFVIGFQTALAYIFGSYIIGESKAVIILAVLSFFAVVGREIIKDIEDVKGDKYKKTIPRKIGIKKARLLSSFFILLPVALSFLPYYFGLFSWYYLPTVVAADLIFIYDVIIQLKNPKKSRKIAKGAMFVALFAFLIGAFT